MRNELKNKIVKTLFIVLASHISLLATACGFEPVYGINRNTPVGAESRLNQVEIANIPDREGQYLRNALIDRFYRESSPASARYDLLIEHVLEKRSKLDVTKASDSTRGQLRLQTSIVLRDRSNNNAKVLERDIRSTTSFNILGSEFATRVTEDNARLTALDDLARQIELQLTLYFQRSRASP